MDIGIGAPTGVPSTSANDLLDSARRAEQRGYSTIAAVDFLWDSLDPLTALASIAAVTDRIRLMTSVLVVPRRGSAAQLAQQVATLHHLSDGRLMLGVGLGGAPDQYRAAQVPVAGQTQRLEASLAEMRQRWTGALTPGDRRIGPALPGGGPDIIVGGHSPAALQRAAAYEGYIGGNMPPEYFAQCVEQVRQMWREAERPGAPRFMATQYFGLGTDAVGEVERFLRTFYQGLPEPFVDMAVQVAATSEEEIRKVAADFEQAGCDELLMMPITADPANVDHLADVLAIGG